MLASWIISHFPKHRIFTECYGGGANVLLRKARVYAEVYNDLDAEIVNVFRVLRDDAKAARLAQALKLTPFARDEYEVSNDPSEDDVEQARRTIVRSLMGFSSAAASGRSTGFRANSNRSGTTPARDWMTYPESVPLFVERLRGVIIENRPALEVIAQHDSPETLHYVDPPYVHETRQFHGSSAAQYRYEMTDADHIEMLEALQKLKGAVVLSGYPCDLYDDALKGWTRIQKKTQAETASERTEVLWISPGRARKGLF